MTAKEYTPGAGMAFGLGKQTSLTRQIQCYAHIPWLCHLVSLMKFTRLTHYCTGSGSHSVDQALALFGRPASVTGFFRAQRDIESEVEDSFTIILQYDTPDQKDLLVTVKTAVTTPMAQQLKLLVRGTKGSFIKVSTYASSQHSYRHPRNYDVTDTYSSSNNAALVLRRNPSRPASSPST